MKIKINIKQLGRKHPLLQNNIIDLNSNNPTITLREFIQKIVEHQVNLFSQSSFEIENIDKTHLPKENYLPILIDTGKLGFKAIYNHNKPDLVKAQEIALQAFEDKLYVVFQGDKELTNLSEEIDLFCDDAFVFIRLTFLVGSYW